MGQLSIAINNAVNWSSDPFCTILHKTKDALFTLQPFIDFINNNTATSVWRGHLTTSTFTVLISFGWFSWVSRRCHGSLRLHAAVAGVIDVACDIQQLCVCVCVLDGLVLFSTPFWECEYVAAQTDTEYATELNLYQDQSCYAVHFELANISKIDMQGSISIKRYNRLSEVWSNSGT